MRLRFAVVRPHVPAPAPRRRMANASRPTDSSFNIYSMQHTRVTGGLLLQMRYGRTNPYGWFNSIRQRFMEQDNLSAPQTNAGSELLTKTPSQSRQELVLPFGSDETLRQAYISPWQHIRIGRLLEDLDAFAGLIAWTHADGPSLKSKPVTMVTASLDQLYLQRTIYPDKDLYLEGFVSWVGTSSMEVQLQAHSQDPERKQPKERCFRALFSMVAIDGTTRKSVPVNRLVPETDEEKARYRRGEENKKRRLMDRDSSLTVSAPTAEERFIIHNLFMKGKKLASQQTMASSVQESLNVCQERNIANKIFGGYLMRKASELAFSCAFMYAKSQPHFVALDDITFLRPVEIGNLLKLRSQVIFSQANHLMVEVEATVHDPLKSEKHLTNRFYFTFECPDRKDELPIVMPQTYEEAMFFLEGKRKFERRLLEGKL